MSAREPGPPTDRGAFLRVRQGGRGIWTDDPEDCDLLMLACLQPAARRIFSELPGDLREPSATVERLQGDRSLLDGLRAQWDQVLSQTHERTDRLERLGALDSPEGFLHLYLALGVARALWAREPDPRGLSLVALVPEAPGGRVSVELREPALVLERGSLKARLLWAGIHALSLSIVIVARTPILRSLSPYSKSTISAHIAETLRDGRIRAGATALPTFDDIRRHPLPKPLDRYCGVVVFLHGLLSTDAGLFDELIADVRRLYLGSEYLLLAYPHDTLTRIDTNATPLIDEIIGLFGAERSIPLAFVAHSRGGLLARETAVRLATQPGPEGARWRVQLAGCVTFGTPHLGSPFAESPAEMLATMVIATGLQKSSASVSVVDILAFAGASGGRFEGIEDLLPATATAPPGQSTTYVDGLRRREQAAGYTVPMLTVGGIGPHGHPFGWFANELFLGHDNDLAVPIESAIPRGISPAGAHTVHSDHFSFFARHAAFPDAIAFLQSRLRYDECGTRSNQLQRAIRVPHAATFNPELIALRRRVGHSPDVRFTIGPGGLIVAEIANEHATARIALHGGHVLAYEPRGGAPVLWVSRQSHYDAGKAIRGGIPVCWPWFAGHPTDAAKPSHGFARTSPWSVLGREATADGATRLRLELTDSEATRALWPHAFQLELAVTVGAALDVELLVRNTGATAFTCTGALHSYFAVSDVAGVAVGGLEGTTYLDKVVGYARREQRGPITIAGETDRIYLDTTGDCLIADTGWRRTIRVAKRGSRTTVVWNPWAERAGQLADFGDDEYRGMVCVETANTADDQITVPPGGEHRLATTITVEPG